MACLHSSKSSSWSWVACLLAALLSTPASAEPSKLSLVTATFPPLTSSANHPGFLDVMARAIFQRIGLSVDVTSVPAERALINANSGLDDGDLFRAVEVERNYPDLVRVPEPMMNYEFIAYTLRSDIHIKTWKDLKPFSVAYPSGWKIFDFNVKDVKDITITPSINELFPLLEKGRVDVILLDRWGALWAMRQANNQLKLVTHPLARVDMFMYLNKKHATLAPRIAQALKDMKTDGSYQKLYDETLKPLAIR